MKMDGNTGLGLNLGRHGVMFIETCTTRLGRQLYSCSTYACIILTLQLFHNVSCVQPTILLSNIFKGEIMFPGINAEWNYI